MPLIGNAPQDKLALSHAEPGLRIVGSEGVQLNRRGRGSDMRRRVLGRLLLFFLHDDVEERVTNITEEEKDKSEYVSMYIQQWLKTD